MDLNITLPIRRGTQAAYDALAVKEQNVLYIITDTGVIYLGETIIAGDINEIVSMLEARIVSTITTETPDEAIPNVAAVKGVLQIGTI